MARRTDVYYSGSAEVSPNKYSLAAIDLSTWELGCEVANKEQEQDVITGVNEALRTVLSTEGVTVGLCKYDTPSYLKRFSQWEENEFEGQHPGYHAPLGLTVWLPLDNGSAETELGVSVVVNLEKLLLSWLDDIGDDKRIGDAEALEDLQIAVARLERVLSKAKKAIALVDKA